ncbi:hypothetical protein [Priestia aryabhattai]|uniref:hypothetical protein n=1 Tax=Priestia aryabhattai TaxID=412384 RepID=UPI003D2B3998
MLYDYGFGTLITVIAAAVALSFFGLTSQKENRVYNALFIFMIVLANLVLVVAIFTNFFHKTDQPVDSLVIALNLLFLSLKPNTPNWLPWVCLAAIIAVIASFFITPLEDMIDTIDQAVTVFLSVCLGFSTIKPLWRTVTNNNNVSG